jgi:acetyltransferase-like isoleucine patch superfamily enzyme
MTTPSRISRARFEDPLSLIYRAVSKLYTLWLVATFPFASKGRNLSIHFPCKISRKMAHHISLGNSVIIKRDTWLNIIPDDTDELKLRIDDNCVIGSRSTISAKNLIHFESDVITAPSVLIQDHNHSYEDISLSIREQGVSGGGQIRIEQGSWIGYGAAIVCSRGELTLGRHCVVAANAVVTRSAPPYSVLAGNPARLIKQYDSESKTWVLGSARPSRHEPAK